MPPTPHVHGVLAMDDTGQQHMYATSAQPRSLMWLAHADCCAQALANKLLITLVKSDGSTRTWTKLTA
jgi:hypothetical protein